MSGHICRMEDKRLVKGGIMEGQTRRGRPSESGWMTSKNGARWTYTLSAGWHRTVHSGNGESDGH